jgi:tricorn protease
VGKEGAVIDERFNGGGYIADYIIDYLRRPRLSGWTTRGGEDFTTPACAIFGLKAMLINEFPGSGGDALPWLFRRLNLGPLMGKRTWGVENHGVVPDLEVEFDPKAWREGRDPQLERAVEVVMEELRKSPPQKLEQPPYPNYQR